MTKSREQATTQNNDEVVPLSNKTMSKGKSVACNLSNEINEIKANEATGNSSVNVKYTNDCLLKACLSSRSLSRLSGSNISKIPVTVPTSKR